MIENAPDFSDCNPNILIALMNPDYAEKIKKVNSDYLYWDKAKYYTPKGLSREEFWAAIKISRAGKILKFGDHSFSFKETDSILEFLHNFDMNFGGTLASTNLISEKNRQYYLISSLMEEAIASSQMEGASTTRKVAKEMLRRQAKPKDKSQQMIVNNYNTIRYLSEHKNEKLTPQLLLEIHSRITEKTLDDSKDEGQFRNDDNIFVVNGITGEVAHEPPSCKQIPEMINLLCDFANDETTFIHPIIKAIIIHFMISYIHPFVDGNGRTARSLFYWYMLKKGYWLTEFLSISRVIYKSKNQYEKSFLYTEHDNFDLGYFIHYNLKVLKQAFEDLQIYLDRKSQEEAAILEYRIPDLNERQMQIIKICEEKPSSMFTSKDLETRFNVSVKTLRSDLEGLVKIGLMETVAINKRLKAYTKSRTFKSKLKQIRGK